MIESHYKWQKGNSRYYQIYVQKDMFDHWTITCVWGGINSKLGNYRLYAFENINTALAMVNSIVKRRKQRGYIIIK